jgi:hypothetical protein
MIFCGIAAGADYADIVIIESVQKRADVEIKLARRIHLQDGSRPAAFRAFGNQILRKACSEVDPAESW